MKIISNQLTLLGVQDATELIINIPSGLDLTLHEIADNFELYFKTSYNI